MFIAEVCSNHNGDLYRALELIDTAAAIGCQAVKFQLFRLSLLFAPEVLAHPDYEFVRRRRAWELPLNWLPVLAARAREKGLLFGCTPFYLRAVEELLPFVDFFKVASYELLWSDLLRIVASTGKPVILSTGMATSDEVESAVSTLTQYGCSDLSLLYCVSAYPTPLEAVSRAVMAELRLLGVLEKTRIGWSDHSHNPAVIYALAAMSSVIEFHLDLDGQGVEYGLGHCWTPGEAEVMIKTTKQICVISRQWKAVDVEAGERDWRADPSDGLRPLLETRARLSQLAGF